jgi:hypothetical protein
MTFTKAACLVLFSVSAAVASVQLGDTLVPTGAFPSHEAQYGKGGLIEVASTNAMAAIPANQRVAGMVASVAGGSLYVLGADLTTWTAYSAGGTGGGVTNATGTGRLTLGVSGNTVTGSVDVTGLATGTPVYVESDPTVAGAITSHNANASAHSTQFAAGRTNATSINGVPVATVTSGAAAGATALQAETDTLQTILDRGGVANLGPEDTVQMIMESNRLWFVSADGLTGVMINIGAVGGQPTGLHFFGVENHWNNADWHNGTISNVSIGAASITTGTLNTNRIATGSITGRELASTAVAAGSYSAGVYGFDAAGRCTNAVSGSATNIITVAANSPGTNTVSLSWYTSTQIRMLATNSGSIVRIDYPAPPTGRAAFLAYSLANPNSKSVTYADQGNVYWASNGVFTTTARAMGKYGRVSVANLGASKYEACLIATNSVEIGYP